MMAAKILIIDDENLFREDLAKLLCGKGYDCKTAVDGNTGLAVAEEFGPDVILCDIVMPGQNGIELLGEILRTCPESFMIMITAYGTINTAIEAFRKGASDYIIKPLILEDVLQKIERLLEYKRLNREIRSLRQQLHREIESPSLVGESGQMQKVRELIKKVSTTTSTVLITGASGTGKELVARAIHKNSTTAEKLFVAINCAGIPVNLLESELFGHTKGAFTGADSEREGFFELAGNGTILLDEISEMPLVLQSKLLRVIEEREFTRLGGKKSISTKARFIASTNQNLEELVQSGHFRQDLFFYEELSLIIPRSVIFR
jgi:two-component system response regulator PilR (NtrC family)